MDDEKSLKDGVAGSYAVFSVTNCMSIILSCLVDQKVLARCRYDPRIL